MTKVTTKSGQVAHSYPAWYWRKVRCRSCGEPRYAYRHLRWFLTIRQPDGRRSTVSRYIRKAHWSRFPAARTLNQRPAVTCACIGTTGPTRSFQRQYRQQSRPTYLEREI